MGDPLSVIASSIAIFDGLKEAWRFANDVIKADTEREEFRQRLNCLETFKVVLNECLAAERLHPGQSWVSRLDPDKNENSPLALLEAAVKKMVEILKLKKSKFRHNLKRFKWYSEKKDLKDSFDSIDKYYNQVIAILNAANIMISRHTNKTLKGFMDDVQNDREAKMKEKEETERRKFEEWLSPLDFLATQRQHVVISARTGKWFLDREEFKYWREGRFDVLRGTGESGAGKTVLASIAAQNLMESVGSSPTLCLFLEKKPTKEHSVTNLLGSLLKQLVQLRKTTLTPTMLETYTEADHINAPPTEDEVRSLLQTALNALPSVYIVVDALDEATFDIRMFVENKLSLLAPGKIRLLTTARVVDVQPNEMVHCDLCNKELCAFVYYCTVCPRRGETRFELCPSCKDSGGVCAKDSTHEMAPQDDVEVQIRTPDEDLEIYVRATIEDGMPKDVQDPSLAMRGGTVLGYECKKNPDLFKDVIAGIVSCAEGKFLLAKLYTKSIEGKETLRDIKRGIKALKGGSYSLAAKINAMYDEDMQVRILGQGEQKTMALRILSFVARSRRNLTLQELRHALAAEEGIEGEPNIIDLEGAPERQVILNRTKGLIRIDRDRAATVRLDHATLQEYFDDKRNWQRWFPSAEIDLANTCLWYLSLDVFSQPCDNIEDFAPKQESHPFISYSLQHWGDHVREAGPEVEAAAVRYMQDKDKLDAYIQAAWAADFQEHDRWDVRRSIDPLHVCAWFDLSSTISFLDYSDLDVEEGTNGQTPLMYACRRGNVDTCRRFLHLGADVNKVSRRGTTALVEAILRGKTEIVKLMLDETLRGLDVDMNIPNPKYYNRTALMEAIGEGQEKTAILILQNSRLDINFQDGEGVTGLILAATLGLTKIVRAMLDIPGIDVDIEGGSRSRTALIAAAEGGHWEVVDLLLRHGAKPDLQDSIGGTALLRAVEEGSFKTVQKLMEFELDYHLTDENGRGVAHLAAENGHGEILMLLLPKVPLHEKDNLGLTPFHCACRSGELETAKILLGNGADLEAKDHHGRCPLIIAWQYGQEELMQLCVENGAHPESIEATESTQRLPLWSLARLGDIHLLRTALSSKPDELSLKEPGTGNSCLHCAIANNSFSEEAQQACAQILTTILTHSRLHLDTPDNDLQTPLHLACHYNNTPAAEALVSHEALLNLKDRFGQTPLSIAYTNEQWDLAVLLIEHDAEIDASKVDLLKLLFEAIRYHNLKAVQNLVKAKDNGLDQDKRGMTAWKFAERVGVDPVLMETVKGIKSFVWRGEKDVAVKKVVEVTEEEVAVSPGEIPFRPFVSPKLELDEREAFRDLGGTLATLAERFPKVPVDGPAEREMPRPGAEVRERVDAIYA